jgi:hypothetical protein
MDARYLIGVIMAVIAGLLTQMGQLLQKKAVNGMSQEAREQRFMRTLLTSPLWLSGLILAIVFGTAGYMAAIYLIGPTLVPGLMASGLIVLAVGSVMMNKETLGRDEAVGIVFMMMGITLLGMSRLGIPAEQVRAALSDGSVLVRIAVFTLVLLLLWVSLSLLGGRSSTRKGIIMAFSNGFPFSLSNFWLSPLVAVIGIVLSGRGTVAQIVIFVLACIILVGVNILGIRQTQVAFKYAQATNVIPVQQVPIQICPIFIYFSVFALSAPSRSSIVSILAGVALIIASGFLLGKRTAPDATAVSSAMDQAS